MKVLLIGSGGREHALAWKLSTSPELGKLYLAPGNPGMERLGKRVELDPGDLQGLGDFALREGIDLTVVGPEAPLVAGIADRFHAAGLSLFGPLQAAARLEGSKVFAKQFMRRHGIPTAAAEVADDADTARRLARGIGFPVVLKADGLAAGKGVLLPGDEGELEEALRIFFEERRFGRASSRILVEECLQGEEVSCIGIADGERIVSFASSKDYKRIGEGDTGANTGGMGAHSPSGLLSEAVADEVQERILSAAIRGSAEEGFPFRGVLYAGLMLTADGPHVLEFNVRFGDPEAQALLLRLDEDLLPLLRDAADGSVRRDQLRFTPKASACVVLASRGYPASSSKGDSIEGAESAAALPGVEVFHAGTARSDGRLETAGGRVLNVCATGGDLEAALARAYAAADRISWPGRQLRRDLGRRVLHAGDFEPA